MDLIKDGHVLILGDGNLSFSAAFVKQHNTDRVWSVVYFLSSIHFGRLRFWCTVLETEAELLSRYPTSRLSIEYLRTKQSNLSRSLIEHHGCITFRRSTSL